ncbi:MAG: ABC transporter ATP-binding protein [Chloroflexi bacterium]|nr:ABC transporter ATP-binding protein [Chloroflexota bacterium]
MLKLDSLAVFYGQVQALHGVSLRVGQGEIVALLGANGAGKSTTLRTIIGLLRPASGAIELLGQPIHGLSPERIAARGIALVPEGRRVFPGFTVEGNLELAGLAAGQSARQIQQGIDRVLHIFPALAARRRQYAWSLSGGEQQMMVIGRGLMAEPKLLMLDEPSLGLAPLLVEEVFRVIRQIRESGTTVLLVEQNAAMALEVANRAYVLELGRVVLEGSAAELADSQLIQASYLGGGEGEEL